jgi:hypothetical protein
VTGFAHACVPLGKAGALVGAEGLEVGCFDNGDDERKGFVEGFVSGFDKGCAFQEEVSGLI